MWRGLGAQLGRKTTEIDKNKNLDASFLSRPLLSKVSGGPYLIVHPTQASELGQKLSHAEEAPVTSYSGAKRVSAAVAPGAMVTLGKPLGRRRNSVDVPYWRLYVS